MAIVKMKRLRLFGMASDREELLRQLQHLGCVQIREPLDVLSDPAWGAFTRVDDTALADTNSRAADLKAALDLLKHYSPDKGGLFRPRPQVTEGQLFDQETLKRAEAAAERILSEEARIAAIRNEQAKLAAQKAALAPWLELDTDLSLPSSREVSMTFGALSASADRQGVEAALAAVTELCQLQWAGRDREFQYLLVVCHRSAEEAAFALLKESGFTPVSLRGWEGTAQANTDRLNAHLEKLSQELSSCKEAILQEAGHREILRLCSDRLAQDIQREEVKGRLLTSGATLFLEGWLPAGRLGELEAVLSRYAAAWEAIDPAPEEYPQVPVQLKNSLFSRCMNVVTEMYSLPAYDGTDPNPLMAPFFILFFGIMMADMGYGLLMVAASLFVLFRAKPREGTRNFMELVFWCGISTTVLGALTGGFFGDFIPQIVKILNPASNFEMPALFTPLNDTVAIMIGSIALGCVQIVTGMTVSVVNKIRAGDFIDALFDEITWWIILAGTAMAIFGIGTVAGVPLVLAAGGLMLVFGGTRKAKGFGKVTSLVGLIYNGVTGFFSDALSYVRLMALMLSGSVIASVFNTLGATFGNVVLFVIISMIGNALNLALNLLGCYVHDLRLQCLEFFNRFYKEGGSPYRPLAIQTKYVDIMKEES